MLQRYFQLLKEGHPDALVNIHLQYNKHIFWLGKQLIKDEFVIENLVQDTFLKLWEHRDTIQSPEHIFFFLRFVMKRDCITYYTRPKNQFFRQINSLEKYENYQDYLAGYDPAQVDQHLLDQQSNQKELDHVKSVLPLLGAKRKHLIELCLTHGFQYKNIAEVIGISMQQVSCEVKKAIADIQQIINQRSVLEKVNSPAIHSKDLEPMNAQQEKVLQLRTEKQYSFGDIARELNLSQKEVHTAFMAAYKHMQEQHEHQLESA